MGRGMLKNIVKKSKAEIISIHDVNHTNIDSFMELLTVEEQMKVRICNSPADVSDKNTTMIFIKISHSILLYSFFCSLLLFFF